jgi:hypothetical protein
MPPASLTHASLVSQISPAVVEQVGAKMDELLESPEATIRAAVADVQAAMSNK